MHTIYKGNRVGLRPLSSVEEYTSIDDKLMEVPSAYWGPHWQPLGERRKEFETTGVSDPQSYSVYAIERLDTRQLIGLEEHGSIKPSALWTWFGTHLLEQHQRLGFGIEAKQLMLCLLFENFPIESAYAITTSNHEPARRGLERSGFRYIGEKQAMFIAYGKPVSEIYYAITRREWEKSDYRHTVKRGVV